VGLRSQRASAGSALAFLLGSPTLNPAVLIFITAVLGWHFMLVRLGVGLALVLGAAALANRLVTERVDVQIDDAPIEDGRKGGLDLLRDWLKLLWWELYTIVPGYVAIVLLLGAGRAWLFHPGLTLAGGSVLAVVGIALIGTLFVIPTAGEVPIVQTLLAFGLRVAPAAALLVTLPAISLPTLYIVRSAFPKRVLAAAFGAVVLAGLVAAGIAAAIPGF
jgi:uncharacterized membrane protein YraQ (UPF0718 family)